MKRNKLLILLIATLTVLCSCSYDQLNIENPNNLPLDNFWTSEERYSKRFNSNLCGSTIRWFAWWG